MKLWIWNWMPRGNGPVGFNFCWADTREEAVQKSHRISGSLEIDEETLHEGSHSELAKLHQEYASLFN